MKEKTRSPALITTALCCTSRGDLSAGFGRGLNMLCIGSKNLGKNNRPGILQFGKAIDLRSAYVGPHVANNPAIDLDRKEERKAQDGSPESSFLWENDFPHG